MTGRLDHRHLPGGTVAESVSGGVWHEGIDFRVVSGLRQPQEDVAVAGTMVFDEVSAGLTLGVGGLSATG